MVVPDGPATAALLERSHYQVNDDAGSVAFANTRSGPPFDKLGVALILANEMIAFVDVAATMTRGS